MLKQFLHALRKSPPPAQAIVPLPPADPRVARLLAERAAAQARYAELLPQVEAEDVSVAALLEFARLAEGLELDQECESTLLRILAREPGNADARGSLALLIANDLRLAEAEAHLRHVHALAPTDYNVKMALSMALLGQNKYGEGYQLLRARLDGPHFSAPNLERLPRWQSESLEGKRIVLWSDWGGFGDDFAYIRFARTIRERYASAKIIVAVRSPLKRLFAGQPYIDEVADHAAQVEADYQCSLIDTFLALRLDYAQLPAWPSYLQPPPAEQHYWKSRLDADPRLKVGLVWTSTSVPPTTSELIGRADKHIPTSALAALAGLPGVMFVSLQKGQHIPRLAEFLPPDQVFDETDDLNDFADTAGLLTSLDLLVSMDTAVGHLAGALGVPTLIMMRRGRGYFWPESGEATPWYPSVRMVVQPRLRDWQSVVARVGDTIRRRAAGMPWPDCFAGD